MSASLKIYRLNSELIVVVECIGRMPFSDKVISCPGSETCETGHEITFKAIVTEYILRRSRHAIETDRTAQSSAQCGREVAATNNLSQQNRSFAAARVATASCSLRGSATTASIKIQSAYTIFFKIALAPVRKDFMASHNKLQSSIKSI